MMFLHDYNIINKNYDKYTKQEEEHTKCYIIYNKYLKSTLTCNITYFYNILLWHIYMLLKLQCKLILQLQFMFLLITTTCLIKSKLYNIFLTKALQYYIIAAMFQFHYFLFKLAKTVINQNIKIRIIQKCYSDHAQMPLSDIVIVVPTSAG